MNNEYQTHLGKSTASEASCCSKSSCCTPSVPIVNSQAKVGRNDFCPCKSGRKFKKCCG